MKLFIYICNFATVFLLVTFTTRVVAQNDTLQEITKTPDSSVQKLNMDAYQNRPFLSTGKLPVALGGYVEFNTQYEQTDGVSDGFSFQMRRMTIFLSSTVAKKIKFFSEIEFEDGTKEINIESASLDVEFHPMLNLRGGIIVNPIGAFNQNHDGPRWDFIDRPLSATTILPSTFSNAGMGMFGKHFLQNWVLGYELYLTNGLDDNIISNTTNRTSLAAGKSAPEKFEESNSGLPLFTGKIAIKNRNYGEIGFSYMNGVFNKYKIDGLQVDEKRNALAYAVDFTFSFFTNKLNVTGEVARVHVDVPETYIQNYGSRQWGGFVDVLATALQRNIFGWEKAKLNLGARFEYVDYNTDKFRETGSSIADNLSAITPTVAFRPVGSTVVRFNYKFISQKDLLGNPPSKTGIIQFGFSSYF